MILLTAGMNATAAFARPAGLPNGGVRFDDVPPTATLAPAHEATGVSVGSNLVLTFSEPVTKANSGAITIAYGTTSQRIELSAVALADDGLTATIDPVDFPYAAQVGVSVPEGAFTDAAGNAYAGTTAANWAFTTKPEPDTQAPTATLSPGDGATNVPVGSTLVLTFSEPVTKGDGNITITHGATDQRIKLNAVDLSADGLTATIDPDDFPYAATVEVTVPNTAFSDPAGNAYAGTTAATWRFTTGAAPDTQAPTASLSPVDGATNVPVSTNLVLTFSERVTKGTGDILITHGATSQSIPVNDVALSPDGLTATVDPADFPYATPVSVSVPNTAFKDEAGNAYAGTTATNWRYTTGTAPDTKAPTANLSPANGAANVSISSNLVLTFSEPVTKAGSGSITITHGATSQRVELSAVDLSQDGLTASINPADFPYEATVGVSVPGTAFSDLAGNAYAGTTTSTWRFTTGAAPDTQAPALTILSPPDGAIEVPVSSNLVLTFSEPVVKGTGTILITHGATGQSISVNDVALSADGVTATVDPANFPYATAVSVMVPGGAFRDGAGNAFAGVAAGSWRFTTGAAPDTQAPTATLSPANGATNVSVSSNLVLTFSEPVTKATSGSITITHGATSQSIALSSVTLAVNGLTATIDPANFPYSTVVGVSVPNTAFKDLAGNAYAGTTATSWRFTTGNAPDTQAPTATLSPANGATNVSISNNLVLTFSEPVTKATTGSITIIHGATGQSIALSSVVLSADGLTATVDPANFPYSTTVGISVPNTAFKDLAGNAYAGTTATSWSFTTGAAPDTQAPTASLSPANGATGVSISSNLVLTFSEPVTKASTGSITITHGATSQTIALSSIALSLNGLTATIDPVNFPYSTVVGINVPNTAFKDAAGNAYAGTTSAMWSFTTGSAPDTQAPTASLSPANGATNVPVSSNLVLTFSEPVTKAATGSITITHGATSQSIALSSVTLSLNGLTATVDPADFPYSTAVGVSVPNAVFKDLAGNAYAGTTSGTWSFTTGAAPDTQAPTATLSPANGATGVSVSGNLVLTFSEPVTKATTGSVTITHGTTTQTIALSSVVLSVNGLTATIDPANFPYATAVGVAVPGTAFRDPAGNAYAGTTSTTWRFTTAAAPMQEIRVNFQDAATVPPAGWLRDYGQPFGVRTGTYQGANMTYGWKKRADGTLLDLSVGGSSNLGNGRNRNGSLDPDIDVLPATLMHMQADDIPTTFNGTKVEGYWEIKVPNGGYDVTVSVGDGVLNTTPEVHSLNAEGVSAIAGFAPAGAAGSATRFRSATARVVVSDGNLTLNADGGTNTKINSVRIVPVTTGPFLYWSAAAQTPTVAQGGTGSFALQLKTSDPGTVSTSLSAAYGVGGSGWLSFNASQSTSTPTVSFTCLPGALPVGKYTATVTAAAAGYTPASYVVTMNVIASRPYVNGSNPADGAQNVSVSIASVVANDLYVPEVPGFKGGVNNATLTTSTVKLLKVSNGIETPLTGIIQGTGGGDAISFTPSFALESNTTYRFVITDGVKSHSGAAFLPYAATFKTGTVTTNSGQLTGVSFRPVPQAHTEGERYTSLTIGPDRKLYGLLLNGTIKRFPILADGSLGAPQQINTLTATYGTRSAVGLTFDPAATATNLIVWVSHCSGVLDNAPLFDGNVSRLSGPNLETPQLVLSRLPRSKGDHLVNSMAFGPDGALYISQGSNSSMGAYDATWQREESLLAGAILRLDRSKLTGLTLPLNVETTSNLTYINAASSSSMRFPDGKYNPYAGTSPLTIYASGVRNAYDLVWHTNGQLYVPANGSASGGNSPASVTGTRRPNGTFYNGPAIPATTAIQVQNDWLFRVNPAEPVGYYGHPNPLRGEYVTNRGYPDNNRYATNVVADINYGGAAYNFGLNKSPNGVIEYKNATAFGGVLRGKLLVCRFSGGSDIMVLEPGATTKVTTAADDFIYDIVRAWTGAGTPGIPGLSGFANPLDITEDTQMGNLYVSEHAWEENDTRPPRITLLKVNATLGQGIAAVSPAKIVDNDVFGGTAGKYHPVTLANTGSGNLKVTSIALTGLDASQFTLAGAPAATATAPYTLLPNSALTFSVAFNPATTGVKTAKIQIGSENNTVREVVLSGLGTKGLSGTNEPSLQQILDVHGVFVTAGDNDKTTSVINSLSPTATLLGGELRIQQFVRSNDGPVTVEVLGVFGPQSTGGTVTGFGWYPAGSTTTKNGLFTVPNSGYQTVNVPVTGSRSFDPGTAVFGFYSQWPFFTHRVVYQEDPLNAFTGAIPHHLRVYPLKTSTGATVPDAYVLAFEETTSGYDYQDLAVIVRNVKPAPVKTVMIDFRPPSSATQAGYTPDAGLAYDATRGFGWIDPVTKAPKVNQAYARERAGTDELRVRTFNAMRPTTAGSAAYANWEYKVVNGFYKVTVQVGDPGFYDSFHYINAEGVSVISNFVPTATNKYKVVTKTVEVKDGKLTIDANGTPANNNTKIGYLIITPATSLAGRLAADENPEARATDLDVVAYPNPTGGHVTLAFTGLSAEETVTVTVISPIGVVCRQENHTVTAEDGSLALDLGDLKAGTYLVKVQSGDRVKLVRVVKR